MRSNCGAREKTLQSTLETKEIKPVNLKGNQPWIHFRRTDAEAETLILWPRMQTADSLEKTLILGNIEGRRRGQQRIKWLMASPMQWIWTWADSRSWCGTGKPGVLQSMRLQRVGHNLVTEQQQPVHGLLIVVGSLVEEHRLQGSRASAVAACGLRSCSSWALAHGLNSCGA